MADFSIGQNECPEQAAALCGKFRIELGEGTWDQATVLAAIEANTGFQLSDLSPLDVANAVFQDTNFTLGKRWDDGSAVIDPITLIPSPVTVGDVNTDADITINGGTLVDFSAAGVATNCGDFDEIIIREGYGVLSGEICQKVATDTVLALDRVDAVAGSLILPTNLFATTGPYEYALTPYPMPDAAVATVTLDDPATGAYTLTQVAPGSTEFGFTVTDTSTGYTSNIGVISVNFSSPLLDTQAQKDQVSADTNNLFLRALKDGGTPDPTDIITVMIAGITVVSDVNNLHADLLLVDWASIGLTKPDGSPLDTSNINYSGDWVTITGASKNDPDANGGVVNPALAVDIPFSITIADGFTSSTSSEVLERFTYHLYDNSARSGWYPATSNVDPTHGPVFTYNNQYAIGGPVWNTDAVVFYPSAPYQQHIWGNGALETWIGETFRIVEATLCDNTVISTVGADNVAVGGGGGITAIKQFNLMVGDYLGETLTYNGFNQANKWGYAPSVDYAFGHGSFATMTCILSAVYEYTTGVFAGQKAKISFTNNYR